MRLALPRQNRRYHQGRAVAPGFRGDQSELENPGHRRRQRTRRRTDHAVRVGRDPRLPRGERGKYEALQWLMFQMGGVGPMFGQAHHFLRFAPEPLPYAIKRYSAETARLYGVLDKRLAAAEYLAGEYSIADIATFPWVARHEWQKIALADYPNVARWFAAIGARPAVQRGMAVPG